MADLENKSPYGFEQIVQDVHDRTNHCLRTTPGAPVGTATEVAIAAADDSIQAWLRDGAGTSVTVGQKAMASSLPVVLASNQTAVPVSGAFYQATQPVSFVLSGTATLSNVSGSATSVTLLSSNASRLGASIHNDSTAILYLKLGTTASTTSFTVKMQQDDHYEVPSGYTGRIDGIWASATGSARVSEFT